MFDERRQAHAFEFVIQECEVEWCVVDDDLGALHEFTQFLRDLVELRLIAEELGRQAVHRQRRFVRLALGVDVAVEVIAGQLAVQDFDATVLDDAVAGARIQACGFGIEDDLAHAREDSKSVEDNQ
jgi:hypothetical protein